MSEPAAWLILYGPRLEYRCVILEKARAESTAARMRGVLVPLVAPEEFAHLLQPSEPAGIERGR